MSAKQDKDSIPKGYQRCFMSTEDGKAFITYYNPTEKDSLKAYIKKEVN